MTMMAEEGQLVQTPKGPRFDMENGSRQVLNHADGSVTTLYFDRYSMDISLYAKEEGLRSREPEERYLSELWDVDDMPQRMQGRFKAEGHHRLAWPILSFALPLLAATILLRGEFNRRGLSKRILLATACVLSVVFIDLISKFLTQTFPWCAMFLYLNVFGAIILSFWLLADNRPSVSHSRLRH